MTDYQYLLADFSTRKVIDLGQVVRTGVSFSPDFSRLFMIKHTMGPNGVNPINCTLTMVNLSTLASTDIEQDDCNQASDITILDKVNKVAYLDSASDGGTLTPYLHLVDMNTLAVTKFPMTAINGINSLAPNQRYIGLIADTVHSDGRDATTLAGYEHPVLNIFDVQQEKIVYSHDCLALADFAQCIVGSSTGTAAYFMAGTYDNPTMYFVKLGATVEATPIPKAIAADSISDFRYSPWSPDGRWLMTSTKTGIQLASASDINKRIPITTTVPAGMTASWYAKNNIELRLSDNTRWLVTVPSL